MLQLRAFSVRFVELVCLPAHHWMWVISWACGDVTTEADGEKVM